MKKIIKVTIMSLILVLSGISAFVWADSNGIWHEAEDVLPGTFGSDEVDGDYIFNNSKIGIGVVPTSDVDVDGDMRVRGTISGDPATGNVVVQLG